MPESHSLLQKVHFFRTCDVIAQAGQGIRGPNPYQLTNIYLPKEVDDLRDYIQSLKRF